ncbi:MAG: hypothetical protein AB1540_14860 [Bdellovibrionota bacterium]
MEKLIKNILSQPTAPFRESWVKQACLHFCSQAGLPVFEDEIGNLWVGAEHANHLKSARVVFVAHLDHPGIVIEQFYRKQSAIYAAGKWLGGGPMDIRSFPVKIFSDVNGLMLLDGKVESHTKGPRGPDRVKIKIEQTLLADTACTPEGLRQLGPWGACLWYGHQGVETGVSKQKELWVTKAADDLIGVCALLKAFENAGHPPGVVMLLSRAEESGFHGTLAVLEKGLIQPKKTLMVSIETSSQLPGAELGKGPVVRLGDRATVFDPAFVYWVQERATELSKKKKAFRFQRKLMDGGTCEATAFNCYGFKVAGISTPLQNYHNLSKSGKPMPEAVHTRDVEQLVLLLTHLMQAFRPGLTRELGARTFRDYTARLLKNQRAHEKYF